MSPASIDHEHRTLRRFGFELFILIVGCVPSFRRALPSVVGDLESANRSSRERWKFATSGRFLVLVTVYFPLLLLLNRSLGLPDDVFLFAVQIFGVATLFFLTFGSTVVIPSILAAALKFPAVVATTITSLADQFSDFVPEVLTPPPNF